MPSLSKFDVELLERALQYVWIWKRPSLNEVTSNEKFKQAPYLKVLEGLSREETVQAFKRAKIFLDLFLPGKERRSKVLTFFYISG